MQFYCDESSLSGLGYNAAEHQLKVMRNDVIAQISAETDPARRKELIKIRKKLKDKIDAMNKKGGLKGSIGKIVGAASLFVPALKPVSMVLSVKSVYDQAKAGKEGGKVPGVVQKYQRASLVSALKTQIGAPTAQAERIASLVEAGTPVEDAVQKVAAEMPFASAPPSAPAIVAPPVASGALTSSEARARFFDWLSSWRPEVYAHVTRTRPDLVDTVAGLGDWTDTLSDWASSVSETAGQLLKVYADKKMLDAQIDRARKGLSPAPTATASAPTSAPASAGGFMSNPTGLLLALGLAVGAVAMFGSRRG